MIFREATFLAHLRKVWWISEKKIWQHC